MNQQWLKKYISKDNLPYIVSFFIGLITLFFFFFPYLYSIDKKTDLPIFVSGFDSLLLLQDTNTIIHYGVTFILIGYIFSAFLLLFGALGIFGKKEWHKSVFPLIFTLSLFQVGFEITGIVFLSKCQNMNLYLEFGSYLSVILKGIFFIFLICYFFYLRKMKRKAS